MLGIESCVSRSWILTQSINIENENRKYSRWAGMAKVAAEEAGERVRCNLVEYLEKGIVKYTREC